MALEQLERTKPNAKTTAHDGLRDLIRHLVRPLPVEGSLQIRVGEFRELSAGKWATPNGQLEEDLKSLLTYVEGVKPILEDKQSIDIDSDQDYYLSGLVQLRDEKLRITAVLRDSSLERIVSSANVIIALDQTGIKEFVSIKKNDPPTGAERYRFMVDSLLFLEPDSLGGKHRLT